MMINDRPVKQTELTKDGAHKFKCIKCILVWKRSNQYRPVPYLWTTTFGYCLRLSVFCAYTHWLEWNETHVMKFESIYFLLTTRPGAFQKGNEENCLLVVQINICDDVCRRMPFLCVTVGMQDGSPGPL